MTEIRSGGWAGLTPHFQPDTATGAADAQLGTDTDVANLDESSGLGLLEILHPVQRQPSPNAGHGEPGLSTDAGRGCGRPPAEAGPSETRAWGDEHRHGKGHTHPQATEEMAAHTHARTHSHTPTLHTRTRTCTDTVHTLPRSEHTDTVHRNTPYMRAHTTHLHAHTHTHARTLTPHNCRHAHTHTLIPHHAQAHTHTPVHTQALRLHTRTHSHAAHLHGHTHSHTAHTCTHAPQSRAALQKHQRPRNKVQADPGRDWPAAVAE